MSGTQVAKVSDEPSVEELMIRAAAAQPLRLERLDAAFANFAKILGPAFTEQCGAEMVSWLQNVTYDTCGKVALDGGGLYVEAEARPWPGIFHLRLDNAVLGDVVNQLLPSVPEEGSIDTRPLSPIERRVGLRMLDGVVAALMNELAEIRKLTGRALKLKEILEDGDLGPSRERCVTASFGLDLDGNVGTMEIIMPFTLFGPDLDMLSRPKRKQAGPESGGWRKELSRMISTADIKLKAVFGTGSVTLGEALAWRPGRTLDLDIEAEQPVDICIGERPIFLGAAGRRGATALAVKITDEVKKGEGK
jgi:flagellar motor switch protein FliM